MFIIGFILMMNIILSGCTQKDDTLDRTMELRNRMLTANGCTFTAEITADFGEELYSFTMNCSCDHNGNMAFEVMEPDAISGITGQFGDTYSDLTFDGYVLAFPRLADGRVTPVSAPWIFVQSLRSGYICGYLQNEDETAVMINDTYEDEALELTIWLDMKNIPEFAEIVWQGRRVLSLRINDFAFM